MLVGVALEAAQKLELEYGVSSEVINLRSIRPLDIDTILTSLAKTNNLVIVEGGWPMFGIGSEISAQVTEGPGFDFLDGPIIRVTGADIPMPYNQVLEQNSLPSLETIVRAARKALQL